MAEGAEHRCGVVAVVGRPNVGKSTLVNRLVGEKVSIISPAPQTTRNRITGVCSRPGAQIVLLDTPGIHTPRHHMNRRMVEIATASLAHVDLIYLMIEAEGLGPGDRYIAKILKREGPPVFLLVNKIDAVRRPALLPILDGASKEFPFAELVPISAKTGENVDRLVQVTLPRLPEGPPLFPEDQPTDQPERFIASEAIREKICLHTRQEIPHETAVLIDVWRERQDGIVSIDAYIIVEKENQKGIVIGRQGSLLKQIGTEARLEIEALLACKVFLRLWVKVVPGWREDPRVLHQIGLA